MCQIVPLLQEVGAEVEAEVAEVVVRIVELEAGVAEVEVIKNLQKLPTIINRKQKTILSI